MPLPTRPLSTLLLCALALAGCGGGDDTTTPTDPATGGGDTPPVTTRMANRPSNATCVAPANAADVATRLSGTGCFTDTAALEVAEGVIPYTVNNLLWSDGEKKGRYFAIPDGTTIALRDDTSAIHDTNGNFDFPVGSVLIKHFFNGDYVVETRLLMRHANDGWAGYAYEWNAEQTDATLLTTGKQITTPVSHYFPSPAECMECHTDAALVALGPDTLQLNYTLRYDDGSSENFLDALDRLGFLEPGHLTDAHKQHRLYALGDDSATVEQRVRSYLHSNCASCHRTGGPAGGLADLRYTTSFAPMVNGLSTIYNVCNATQGATRQSPWATALIEPGDSTRSALAMRINSTAPMMMMPPVGRATVDTEAATLIRTWIDSLTSCDGL